MTNTNNLFIDTSNNCLVVVLENNNKIIDQLIMTDIVKVSDIANGKISEFLKHNNLSLRDIINFYITTGPGSYTGVRVALTIVKTIKTLNENVSIYTMSSLQFVAAKDNVISMIDAKGDKWYLGVYKEGVEVIVDQLIPNDILDDFIKPFDKYEIKNKYSEIDFASNFLIMKNYFKLIEDVNLLLPTYIKHYI